MSIIDDATRRRWKRIFKRRSREAVELGQQADQEIERLLIRRLERLTTVKRFIALWLALFFLLFYCAVLQIRSLDSDYQKLVPVPGGVYTEGIVSSFTNANPLYATGSADSSISHLIFSGLFDYNDQNQLTGDLALNWTENASGTVYTVNLRHNVTWQDGAPFTAADVVYTYQTIQNPVAQSPLYSSWEGITVAELNKYAVTFTLPDALSSFPYNLTNGIVPEHLLAGIDPEQLRSANFNVDPIGTGPFAWQSVAVSGNSTSDREQSISLTPFSHYWVGPAKLDGFTLDTFSSEPQMITAFESKQLNAMSDLTSFPSQLDGDKTVDTYITPLTSEVMAFFNNSQTYLSDSAVRKALVTSVNQQQLIDSSAYPTIPLTGPLLRGQLGYDPAITQDAFNFSAASQTLTQDGWVLNSHGQRVKNGVPLELSMVTQNTPDYIQTAQFLQQAWSKLGVRVSVTYYDSDDLQSEIIANHDYDILLYGINIGVDPDVYAYWDSSQASVSSQGHLNLSEYMSTTADETLEAARTRSNPATRAINYQAFVTQWVADAPALALYQPNFLYVTRGPVFNYQRSADNSSVSRFSNVNQWEIRQQLEDIN